MTPQSDPHRGVRRILLCAFVDGDTKPTHAGLALLLGVSVDHLLEVWDPASGVDTLPTDLKRRGMKRAKSAKDALGNNVTSNVLGFWVSVDWPHARIDFDEAGGQMWAVIDEAAEE